MTSKSKDEELEGLQGLACMMAMAVRNAMEDFHCDHLTDDQMKQLNPIIRNVLYTALHSHFHYSESDAAKAYFDYNVRMIPNYWESPEFLAGYAKMRRSREEH